MLVYWSVNPLQNPTATQRKPSIDSHSGNSHYKYKWHYKLISLLFLENPYKWSYLNFKPWLLWANLVLNWILQGLGKVFLTKTSQEQVGPMPSLPTNKAFVTRWWFQLSTHLKNISQNWIISPRFGVKIKKYLSCHQPGKGGSESPRPKKPGVVWLGCAQNGLCALACCMVAWASFKVTGSWAKTSESSRWTQKISRFCCDIVVRENVWKNRGDMM